MPDNNTLPKDESQALNARHLAELEARAIPLHVAVEAGLVSVDLNDFRSRKEAGVELEWPNLPLHAVTGILIPYQETRDGIRRCRVRSDVTEYTTPGPIEGTHHGETTVAVPRYICQAGVAVVPYLTRHVLAVAEDVTQPIYITEAPLKALCLSAHGMPAIGLGGVLAGAHDPRSMEDLREVVANDELRRVRWRGRKVYVAFDAGLTEHDDHPGNPMVALGAAYVSKALGDLGADVHLVRLPYFHPKQSNPSQGIVWRAEDQGPDDFIKRIGAEAFRELVTAAIPADPLGRVVQTLEAGEKGDVTAQQQRAGGLVRELFFQATLHVGGDATVAAVATVTSKVGMGKKVLKDGIQQFRSRLARRATEGQAGWVRKFACTAAGTPRSIRENVELALRRDPQLDRLVAFDDFGQSLVFTRTPPWTEQYTASGRTKAGDAWTDEDDVRLSGYLAARYGIFDLAQQKVRAAVAVVARNHLVHPVRDFLRKLTWDEDPRIDTWLVDYFGVADTEYARRVGRWWLLSAVARIWIPGCKVDHVLVLEGHQGLAKSSALRVLAKRHPHGARF